jgi:hypothetical protein
MGEIRQRNAARYVVIFGDVRRHGKHVKNSHPQVGENKASCISPRSLANFSFYSSSACDLREMGL